MDWKEIFEKYAAPAQDGAKDEAAKQMSREGLLDMCRRISEYADASGRVSPENTALIQEEIFAMRLREMKGLYAQHSFRELVEKNVGRARVRLRSTKVVQASRVVLVETPTAGYLLPVKYKDWEDFSYYAYTAVPKMNGDYNHDYSELYEPGLSRGHRVILGKDFWSNDPDVTRWLLRLELEIYRIEKNQLPPIDPAESLRIADMADNVIMVKMEKTDPSEMRSLILRGRKPFNQHVIITAKQQPADREEGEDE